MLLRKDFKESITHMYANYCKIYAEVRICKQKLRKLYIVSYLSIKTFVFVVQKYRLSETVLLSTENICFS